MKNIIKIIKGILVGFISIIPGISGSMIAAALNIYEEIIDALSNLIKSPIKSIKNVWEYGVGIIIGVGLGVVFVATILQRFPLQISLLFVGLIIGGIPQIIKENKKQFKLKHITVILITSLLILLTVFLSKAQTPDIIGPNNHVKYSLIGVLIAGPIIIPGVSGAMVLSTLGYYDSTMSMIKDFLQSLFTLKFSNLFLNITPVLIMGVGAIVGLIIFSKIIKLIVEKYPTGFNSVILGVLLISPITILYALNSNLLLNNQTIKDIMNTGNVVVSSFFLILGFLIAFKTSILKEEKVKPAEVTNLLRSTKFMLADSLIIITSYLIPMLIFHVINHDYNYPDFLPSILTIIVAKIVLYYFLGLYNIITKHLDFKSLFRIVIITISSNLLIVALLTLPEMPKFMYKTAFLVITSIEVSGFVIYRLFIKIYLGNKILKEKSKVGIPTIIVGAGRLGEVALEEINYNPKMNNEVIGFLDDDSKKLGRTILGKPIIGDIKDLPLIIKKHDIKEVILAIKNYDDSCKKIIDKVYQMPFINIKKVSMLEEYNNALFKDIDISEILLGETEDLNQDEYIKYFENKNILITGSGGTIGSDLAKTVLKMNPKKLILLDINENGLHKLAIDLDHIKIKNKNIKTKLKIIIANITDLNLMEQIFQHENLDLVFHAAAYKHIPFMENNIKEAISVNIVGTKNICFLSNKYKANKVILMSTNKAINPKSVMGLTKKYSEDIGKYFNSLGNTNISIVRFGNIVESSGGLIETIDIQIKNGGPVIISDKESADYFMTQKETINLIIKSLTYSIGGETFVYDMKGPLKILDIANKIANLYGVELERDIGVIYKGVKKGHKLRGETYKKDKYIKTNDKRIFIEKSDDISHDNLYYDIIINNYNHLSEESVRKLLLKGIKNEHT